MRKKKKKRDQVRPLQIPREPYPEVKRALRQEVHYACPVPGCGRPLLEFHHFDPPWQQKHHQNPEGMIALCTVCHPKADRGTWTKAQLHSFKRNPPPEELIRTTFGWSERSLLYRLGSVYAADNNEGVLAVGAQRMLWEERSAEGRLLFSLNLFGEKGQTLLQVRQNSLSIEASRISDLIINAGATYLKLWLGERKPGIELQFHRFSLKQLKEKMEKNAKDCVERIQKNHEQMPDTKLDGSPSSNNGGEGLQDNPALNFAFDYASHHCLDSDGTVTLVTITRARFYASGRLVEVFDHGIRLAGGSELILSSSFANGGFGYNL